MVSFKCKFCCKVQKWFLNGGGEGQTLVAAFAYDGKQNGFLLLIFHIWWGGLSPVTTEDGSPKFLDPFEGYLFMFVNQIISSYYSLDEQCDETHCYTMVPGESVM